MTRDKVAVSSDWGEIIGYSRAVRAGNLIFISGTTASGSDGAALCPNDAKGQAKIVLERIAAALHDIGSDLQDVVETRIYLTDITQWEAVGRIHGATFRNVRPATTIVQVGPLVAPDLLVEISATALAADH